MICFHFHFQVDVAQKLPSLYLLDSILKNVGGEYVDAISHIMVDTFCHVFESVRRFQFNSGSPFLFGNIIHH